MMFPLLFLFRWSIFILFSNRLHLSDVFEFFFRFIRRICRIWNFFWSSRKSPKLKKRTKFFRIRNFVEALAIPCFISARWVSRAGLIMIRRCACQGHTVSCIKYRGRAKACVDVSVAAEHRTQFVSLEFNRPWSHNNQMFFFEKSFLLNNFSASSETSAKLSIRGKN